MNAFLKRSGERWKDGRGKKEGGKGRRERGREKGGREEGRQGGRNEKIKKTDRLVFYVQICRCKILEET